ncbi:MAG: rod shape-determining protein MreC [Burkholderiales bacterium]|nr:rod shape-determining protein MreC [Burkholderiales bacterium]
MEYAPPPFFKQGPSALARLGAFALLSLILLIADARFRLLEQARFAFATVLYPLQRAARAPGDAASGLGGYLEAQRGLLEARDRLERERLDTARGVIRNAQLESENANLRSLLAMRERVAATSVAAEMLYDARDPFTRKVIIDKGTAQGIAAGQVVIDAAGVMGQVTRVFPMLAEVSLLTDRDQAIPVQVVRNGLRAVAYGIPGGPDGGALELRFLATNADVREGDMLVTSGLDGVYLPGLPVARVARVEREAGYAFARIICKPAAGVDRHGHVLVLTAAKPPAPPPAVEEEVKPAKGKRKKLRSEEPGRGAEAAAPASGTAPAASGASKPPSPSTKP